MPDAAALRSWSSYRSEPVMALAKMVGLEVAPVIALSAINRANAPLSSSSRESVSSQMETPAWWSCSRRFMRALREACDVGAGRLM